MDSAKYSDNLRDFVSKCLEKDVKKRISADHALHHPFIVSAFPSSHLATWLHSLQYSPHHHANNDIQRSCSMVSLQVDHDEEEEDDDSAPTTPDDVSPTSLHIPNRNLLLHTPKEFHLF